STHARSLRATYAGTRRRSLLTASVSTAVRITRAVYTFQVNATRGTVLERPCGAARSSARARRWRGRRVWRPGLVDDLDLDPRRRLNPVRRGLPAGHG